MQEFSIKSFILAISIQFHTNALVFCLGVLFTVAITDGFSIATGSVHHGESSKLNLAMAAMNVKPKNHGHGPSTCISMQ